MLQISVAPGALRLIAGIALLFICIGIVLLKGIIVFLLHFTGIALAEGIRPVVDRLQRWHVARPRDNPSGVDASAHARRVRNSAS